MSGAIAWTAIVGFLTILAAGQAALIGLVLALVRAETAVLREQIEGLRREMLARVDARERDLQRRHAFEHEEPPAA